MVVERNKHLYLVSNTILAVLLTLAYYDYSYDTITQPSATFWSISIFSLFIQIIRLDLHLFGCEKISIGAALDNKWQVLHGFRKDFPKVLAWPALLGLVMIPVFSMLDLTWGMLELGTSYYELMGFAVMICWWGFCIGLWMALVLDCCGEGIMLLWNPCRLGIRQEVGALWTSINDFVGPSHGA